MDYNRPRRHSNSLCDSFLKIINIYIWNVAPHELIIFFYTSDAMPISDIFVFLGGIEAWAILSRKIPVKVAQ